MNSKFGLKDFVLLLLVFIVGLLMLLSLWQADRRHQDVKRLASEVADVDRAIRTLRNDLTSGAIQAAPQFANATAPTRDDSWAVAGVPITYPRPFAYPSNPVTEDDFSPGGEFVEIFEAQLKKITPYFYDDVYGRRIIDGPICESLAVYDPETLELVGLLAEAWQLDPNGLWLRAKIRNNARFSDGEPVTAQDFEFTYDLVMNPQHATARFRSTLEVVSDVTAIDDTVVEFTFHKPQFSNKAQALRMYVIPEHFYEDFQPQQLNEATGLAMGSGPYRLESLDANNQWTQGEPVVLVRNENYWGQQPPFDRRRYIVRQDAAIRLAAFQNREGDMMRAIPPQYQAKTRDEQFLANNHALDWKNMRSGFAFIAWNCGERNGELTPFHDKRVRQAMTLLLDREAYIRDIVNGLADIATSPFPPDSPQINPDIEPWPYDPERAQQLLAEAGWIDRNNDGVLEDEDGRPFVFEYTRSSLSSPVSQRSVDFLRQSFERAGIVMELNAIDWSVMSDAMDKRDFDAITMQWSASSPESDPKQLWHSDSIQDAGDNFAQWNNPEADALIEAGRATLDDRERMAVWHQLHELLHEEQPYTFLYNARFLRFINGEIANVNPYKTGLNIEEMYLPEPGI